MDEIAVSPVICFEPGIVKREGRNSRFVENMCGTLRADMGDNQPAVCFKKCDSPKLGDGVRQVEFREKAGKNLTECAE